MIVKFSISRKDNFMLSCFTFIFFRLGRRFPIPVTAFLIVVMSFASCVMPNYLSFIIFRLVLSIVLTIRDNTGVLLGKISINKL